MYIHVYSVVPQPSQHVAILENTPAKKYTMSYTYMYMYTCRSYTEQ